MQGEFCDMFLKYYMQEWLDGESMGRVACCGQNSRVNHASGLVMNPSKNSLQRYLKEKAKVSSLFCDINKFEHEYNVVWTSSDV